MIESEDIGMKNYIKRNKVKGFTLVELLAVIVILAIILVIAVPKIMSVIDDSKKATLESTAKMIASTAEKQKVQNTVLGNTDSITCDSVAKINDADYEDCNIDFDENTAKVTIKGSGKFDGLWVCEGTKINATAINESCGLRTLTVYLDGGTVSENQSGKYEAGSEIILTEPTKEGYTFNGWTVTGIGARVNGGTLTMGSEATTVTATWKVFVPYGYGNTYISNLLDNESTLNNGLVQTTATYNGTTYDAGIRYVGELTGDNAVKNQVYFNCEPTDGTNAYGSENYNYASSCEVWRIIGVFNTKEDENDTNGTPRIKIININSTFTASWDSSASTINSGYGVNQWGENKDANGNVTYAGADLMQLLNGHYIEKNDSTIAEPDKKKCKYNDTSGKSEITMNCDTTIVPLSSKNMKPLTSIALNMIDDAVWDTYSVESPSSGSANSSWASTAYLEEKGISKQYTGISECLNCSDGVTRTTSWKGLRGLMSVSDLTYANGWLYKSYISPCTITPFRSIYLDGRFVWRSDSLSAGTYAAYYSFSVWPAAYLSSNIKIIGGDGSEGNAYKLSISA